MEFQAVQESQVPCRLCGEHNAPYLMTHVNEIVIQTPEGERVVAGQVVLCVGTMDRPGCVRNIVTQIGGQQPELVEAEAARQLAALQAADEAHTKRLELLNEIHALSGRA